MLLASMVFTAMGAMAHALGSCCNWQVVLLARAALVLLFVALLSVMQGRRAFVLGTPTLWLRSVAGSLSMICTFYALTRKGVPVSDTLTLTNMFPIWVAVLSWPMLGDRPSPSVWIAILCGAAGVWCIQEPHFGESDLALAAAAAASLFTAIAMLGLHRLHGLDPLAVVVHFSAVATCFAGASFLLIRPQEAHESGAPATIVLLLFGVGVAATFGQVLLTHAFTGGNPSRVSVVALTQVLFALVLDLVVFRHELHREQAVGIVLIIAPTAWVLLTRPRAIPLIEE
jgi:drug/metabolite transporter (DMT)-like permease